MKFVLHSPKFGSHEVLIDEEDFRQLFGWAFYIWTTPRHYGMYVHCYSPDDRRKPKRLHRIIMDAKPGEIVDHINGNPLDNRRRNLRVTTSSVNNQNARKRKDGVTSKYKGVSWYAPGRCWKAQIQIKGKKRHIGYYPSQEDAAAAYNSELDIHDIASPRNILPNNLADLK